jgi:hypothetical protein
MSSTPSSSSSKLCFNSDCKDFKSDRPKKGWRLRTGDLAQLCDRCGLALFSQLTLTFLFFIYTKYKINNKFLFFLLLKKCFCFFLHCLFYFGDFEFGLSYTWFNRLGIWLLFFSAYLDNKVYCFTLLCWKFSVFVSIIIIITCFCITQ